MDRQETFADLAWKGKRKVTRREKFLVDMDQIIPWDEFVRAIEPYYPKEGNGRRPQGLEKMLRIYMLQLWFKLSDPQAEDTLYDSESMRRFVGVELTGNQIPDESTICRFRHILEDNRLTEQIFKIVKGLLERERLLLHAGTIVDATIVEAPTSTKNSAKSRDPEMRSTRKGQGWHFGMKMHVGTDRRGIVHSLTTTSAAAADITEMPKLLHGKERVIFGDQAYWKEKDRQHYRERNIRYRVNRRGHRHRPLTEHQKKINQSRSRTRACGEHAFRIVKMLWGFVKVRYRGLAKNTAQAFAMFAMANLYMVRKHLLPPQPKCL